MAALTLHDFGESKLCRDGCDKGEVCGALLADKMPACQPLFSNRSQLLVRALISPLDGRLHTWQIADYPEDAQVSLRARAIHQIRLYGSP